MALEFYNIMAKNDPISLSTFLVSNWQPNVSLYNQILEIEGDDAVILESQQLHMLVSHLTGDQNLSWFFTIDFNLFKSMVRTSFSNLDLPKFNGKRWAVFAINDAVLDHDMRQLALISNKKQGDHWYTALVLLD